MINQCKFHIKFLIKHNYNYTEIGNCNQYIFKFLLFQNIVRFSYDGYFALFFIKRKFTIIIIIFLIIMFHLILNTKFNQ